MSEASEFLGFVGFVLKNHCGLPRAVRVRSWADEDRGHVHCVFSERTGDLVFGASLVVVAAVLARARDPVGHLCAAVRHTLEKMEHAKGEPSP